MTILDPPQGPGQEDALPTVVLVGCLDTKGEEFAYVKDRLKSENINVLVVDTGVLGAPAFTPDIGRDQVADAAAANISELAAGTGAVAVDTMATGATEVITKLFADGKCDGALALGGTGGTSIGARAFRALPLGVPKAIVSTAVVTGNAAAYVGQSDLVLFPAVTDIAGVNRISGPILANAAAALAGMVTATKPTLDDARPMLAASMFGVTTPGVTAARKRLDQLGYEVIVFHMTGVGGRTLERLVSEGHFAGVLDVTTHELADELVGGVFPCRPDRLTGPGKAHIPHVVSTGALDMINFHTPDTIPKRFADRQTMVHNPAVTIVRTLPHEAAELGKRVASRLSSSSMRTALYLPLQGMSEYGAPGQPFHDPEADAAMFDAIRATLDLSRVELIEMDTHINDPAFTEAMAETLHTYIAQETDRIR
ncbi:Tm-1-like ATP-binding domain-containing protein [Natronoglycomyces albus]|uniref:Tm-1-like ATP-binding domain-containing protein n=1 Tax=Natronoglycomyces albus TaxID=2811108 RepID=A0A895XL89_9ACTN|nr:Tm-1-like ATP-binding domain-containing protein [Natronoglycomyces albus]QSB04562.1 Tm-1-like ATP-binding domain-containing protein [Natronoglycomyces albus]